MMITRCPGCTTTFRVTPEQLKARHGKVRCGQCQHVFNALDTLLDAAVEPPPAPIEIAEPAEHIDLQLEFPVMEETSGEISEPGPVDPAPPDEADAEEQLPAPEPPAKPSSLRTWAWALAAMLALLALLLQAVVQFRVELSVLSPQTKPALLSMCAILGCDLPLPSKADLIGIETSDLNPGQNGQLVLAATLKNRAPFVQAYPYLELTLTDTDDRPLVRKVLPPSDYLHGGMNPASGFPANSDVAVSLTLMLDNPVNTAASGYRLYLFYP
ncbi:MAG: zinc-ribbon domain-containing protein [Betaproteobacteria bacterium]|nr:zinc-ribbon domain-containing protein [Betaproteobacteria bacterium]